MGCEMEGMQFDAGTWWLAVLLLGGVTGLLCWLLKRSYDRWKRKLKVPCRRLSSTSSWIPVNPRSGRSRKTYTTRATHDKDIDECRKKISKISVSVPDKRGFLPRAG